MRFEFFADRDPDFYKMDRKFMCKICSIVFTFPPFHGKYSFINRKPNLTKPNQIE